MVMLRLVLPMLLCVSAISATETLSVWTRPGQCSLLRVEAASVATLEAVKPASASVSVVVIRNDDDLAGLGKRCRSSVAAITGDSLQTYIALLNEGRSPAYAVLKVTRQAPSAPSDVGAAGTVVGRPAHSWLHAASRWLDGSVDAVGAALGGGGSAKGAAAWKRHSVHGHRASSETAVPRAPPARRHRRQLTQSPTSTPTLTPSTVEQQIKDDVSNSLTPTQKKWIKIAIIVGIVLVAICALSLLCCIVRCICWPCCCAARLIK